MRNPCDSNYFKKNKKITCTVIQKEIARLRAIIKEEEQLKKANKILNKK